MDEDKKVSLNIVQMNIHTKNTAVSVFAMKLLSSACFIVLFLVILAAIFFLYAKVDPPETVGNPSDTACAVPSESETDPTQEETGSPPTETVPPPTETTPPTTESEPPPTETTPPPTETEPKIQIDFEIYCVENNGSTAALDVRGETGGEKPRWRSSDPGIADVTSNGKVFAMNTGDAVIYAEIWYEGYKYNSGIEISVDLTRVNLATYTLKYLESLPEGLDQNSDQYKNMVQYHDLYATEAGALASINHVNCTPDGDPVKIGYVYYHWCVGDYNDPNLFVVESHKNEPAPYCYNHNRTSFYKKGPYEKRSGKIVELNKFTCFYSENESEYDECRDGSKCWWIDSSSICNDSYWYWKIPVYKTEYTAFDTALAITVTG